MRSCHTAAGGLLEYKKNARAPLSMRAHTVRLIDEEGQPAGIMSLREAQDLAQSRGLDLIELNTDGQMAVCKLGDYGRLKYQEQKKKAEARKKHKAMLLKEIQLRPNIEEHDYQVKLGHAKNFLHQRDKVKVCLQFRGREMNFTEAGRKLVGRFIEDLVSLGKVESPVKMEGRRLITIIAPLKLSETALKPTPSSIPEQTSPAAINNSPAI